MPMPINLPEAFDRLRLDILGILGDLREERLALTQPLTERRTVFQIQGSVQSFSHFRS